MPLFYLIQMMSTSSQIYKIRLNWQPLAKFERTSFPGRNRPWIKISLQNQLLEQQQWVFDCSFINDSIIAYAVWENAILQYHFFLFSSYKNVSALIAHFGCFR